MGIRFLCPNGHKLNVKAFLAGERGICPQCDAKFLVPSESGGQVEAIAETASDEPPITAPETDAATPANPTSVSQPPTAPKPTEPTPMVATPPPAPTPPPPAAPAPEPDAPPEVWYVRTATGEQFGPAHVDLMRQWVAEGRITVDCFVWRTGWEDWKSGGQAITFLNVVPPEVTAAGAPAPDLTATNPTPTAAPPDPAPATPTEQTPQADAENNPAPGMLPEPTTPTSAYHTKKRMRQERARKITLLLGVVVLILFAVLIGVLINNK